MAYIFRRGASIPFTQVYYDTTGGIINPSSVKVWITYPTSGFPYRTDRETTVISLTTNSTGGYEGSWSSTAAFPGWVYYHIRAADTTVDVVDGAFELRGGPANVAST